MFNRNINFVKDVAAVLGYDCAEIRRKYPCMETEKCGDVLSESTLGELRCDGLELTSLKIREGYVPVGLQEFVINEENMHVPKIILILESPHKDEYRVRCCQCAKEHQCGLYSIPAPARGMTGIAIKMKLPLLFNQRFDDYYVGFMNLIQYQCSLGMEVNKNKKKETNSNIKDKVVWNLIDSDRFAYRSNFIERLKKTYIPDQDIIIVCSTGGRDKRNKICQMVEKDVEDVRCLLSTGHPVSWIRNHKNSVLEIKLCSNIRNVPSQKNIVEDSSELYAILSGEMYAKTERLAFAKFTKKGIL